MAHLLCCGGRGGAGRRGARARARSRLGMGGGCCWQSHTACQDFQHSTCHHSNTLRRPSLLPPSLWQADSRRGAAARPPHSALGPIIRSPWRSLLPVHLAMSRSSHPHPRITTHSPLVQPAAKSTCCQRLQRNTTATRRATTRLQPAGVSGLPVLLTWLVPCI